MTQPVGQDGAGVQRAVRRTRQRALGLLAVAAGLALLYFLLWRTTRRKHPFMTTGGDALELVEPVGAVDAFSSFRWRARSPGKGWFEVLVRPDGAPAGSAPHRSGPVRAFQWIPEPGTPETWGRVIRWTLVWHGEGDETLASADASARLR